MITNFLDPTDSSFDVGQVQKQLNFIYKEDTYKELLIYINNNNYNKYNKFDHYKIILDLPGSGDKEIQDIFYRSEDNKLKIKFTDDSEEFYELYYSKTSTGNVNDSSVSKISEDDDLVKKLILLCRQINIYLSLLNNKIAENDSVPENLYINKELFNKYNYLGSFTNMSSYRTGFLGNVGGVAQIEDDTNINNINDISTKNKKDYIFLEKKSDKKIYSKQINSNELNAYITNREIKKDCNIFSEDNIRDCMNLYSKNPHIIIYYSKKNNIISNITYLTRCYIDVTDLIVKNNRYYFSLNQKLGKDKWEKIYGMQVHKDYEVDNHTLGNVSEGQFIELKDKDLTGEFYVSKGTTLLAKETVKEFTNELKLEREKVASDIVKLDKENNNLIQEINKLKLKKTNIINSLQGLNFTYRE